MACLFLLKFLKEMTNAACDKVIEQPTLDNVKENILLAKGKVVSFRSFKHGKRANRNISKTEFSTAAEFLRQDGFGHIVQFSIPRARGQCKVFIKSKPEPSELRLLNMSLCIMTSLLLWGITSFQMATFPSNINIYHCLWTTNFHTNSYRWHNLSELPF